MARWEYNNLAKKTKKNNSLTPTRNKHPKISDSIDTKYSNSKAKIGSVCAGVAQREKSKKSEKIELRENGFINIHKTIVNKRDRKQILFNRGINTSFTWRDSMATITVHLIDPRGRIFACSLASCEFFPLFFVLFFLLQSWLWVCGQVFPLHAVWPNCVWANWLRAN